MREFQLKHVGFEKLCRIQGEINTRELESWLSLRREASARDTGLRVISVSGMCWQWDLKPSKSIMESLKDTGKSENRTSETRITWEGLANNFIAFF